MRIISVLAAAAALFVVCASSASASPPEAKNPVGRVLGVVHAHGAASGSSGSNSNLLYHSGPVIHANTVYAIYWVPSGYSVSSGYESLINRFFSDVAADSGKTSNVYFSDTQYYDTVNGDVSGQSTFAGPVSDSDAFPSNGCRDRYTKVCLTDSQLQHEISHVISTHGLPTGLGTVYFLFTPKAVGSCYGSSCAYSYFCAYHSWIGSGNTATLYANMPYAAYVPSRCGSGQSPNGNDADSTINVTSHEHNESITDPLGSAWYDSSGNEDGDKCAWNFGTALGSTTYGAYNQSINNDPYYLQQEWSNASSGCVLTGT